MALVCIKSAALFALREHCICHAGLFELHDDNRILATSFTVCPSRSFGYMISQGADLWENWHGRCQVALLAQIITSCLEECWNHSIHIFRRTAEYQRFRGLAKHQYAALARSD